MVMEGIAIRGEEGPPRGVSTGTASSPNSHDLVDWLDRFLLCPLWVDALDLFDECLLRAFGQALNLDEIFELLTLLSLAFRGIVGLFVLHRNHMQNKEKFGKFK